MLIGFASTCANPRSRDRESDVDGEQTNFHQRRLAVAVPDLTVAACMAFVGAAWTFGATDGIDAVSIGGFVTLGGLGALHRLSVLMENHALTCTLEERVAQRTAALDSQERYFQALVEHSSDVISCHRQRPPRALRE